MHTLSRVLALGLTLATLTLRADSPPPGFTSLYNGKDLTGWRGGDTFDHRKLLAMTNEARAKKIDDWNKTMRAHWSAQGDELVNDGKGAYATTEKDYGDFELLIDYKTVPMADSGIYLRGVPQVQIWDRNNTNDWKNGSDKGSGALWNNSANSPGKFPLVLADKPMGEWNKFRILMVGSRVSAWLNDQPVVNHAIMENFYDRKTPVPAKGPIQLQTHGGEIRWRNIFIREIPSDEANRILTAKGTRGLQSIFNGNDLDGWDGPVQNYEIKDSAIVCKPGKGGCIYTREQYADFTVAFQFKLPPNGNNGLAIRYPGDPAGRLDTAFHGMCELQILDDAYKGIDPKQAHGSAYGMVAAHRGYQHPVGEWNYQEVTVKGSTIKVELNGTVILDADLSILKEADYLHKSKDGQHVHPGLTRTEGHFGFAGHGDAVAFRDVRIKKL